MILPTYLLIALSGPKMHQSSKGCYVLHVSRNQCYRYAARALATQINAALTHIDPNCESILAAFLYGSNKGHHRLQQSHHPRICISSTKLQQQQPSFWLHFLSSALLSNCSSYSSPPPCAYKLLKTFALIPPFL